jgi:hypothetical protein
LIDGEREHSKHQVTEHLGVAAHTHMAPTELILEARIDALGGAACDLRTRQEAAMGQPSFELLIACILKGDVDLVSNLVTNDLAYANVTGLA